jgi:hypothetical protein
VKNPFGLNNVVIQTAEAGSTYAVSIDNPYSDKPARLNLPDFTFPLQKSKLLLSRSIHTQVEAMVNKPFYYQVARKDSLSFYGIPNKKYRLDDYVRFPTIDEVLREYVPEVIVRKKNKRLLPYVINSNDQSFFLIEPLVLLDGVPVLDSDKVISGSSKNIKEIEVVTNKVHLGPTTFAGVLNLRTYLNDLGGFAADSGAFIVDFDGLQKLRQFYTPKYDSEKAIKSRLPDFRNVLLWSPEIVTDQNGRKEINFYTSDQRGTFIGILHGVSKDGLVGSQMFTFRVDSPMN